MKDVDAEIVGLYRQALTSNYYSNAARQGCPESSVLKQLAAKKAHVSGEWAEHVCECSPCFREVVRFRRRRRVVIASAAVAAGLAVSPFAFLAHRLGAPARPVEIASSSFPGTPAAALTLEPTLATRGRSQGGDAYEVRPQGGELRLRLAVSAPSVALFNVRIKSVNTGLVVLDQRGLAVRDGRYVDVQLATAALSPGSYIVETSRRLAHGTEPGESYRFRLLPIP